MVIVTNNTNEKLKKVKGMAPTLHSAPAFQRQ